MDTRSRVEHEKQIPYGRRHEIPCCDWATAGERRPVEQAHAVTLDRGAQACELQVSLEHGLESGTVLGGHNAGAGKDQHPDWRHLQRRKSEQAERILAPHDEPLQHELASCSGRHLHLHYDPATSRFHWPDGERRAAASHP